MSRAGKWPFTFLEHFETMPWLHGVGFVQFNSSNPLVKHVHKGHEFTFLLEGEVAWETVEGESLDLHGGSLGMTQPEIEHWGRRNSVSPCKLIWFIADLESHDNAEFQAIGKELGKCGNLSIQAGKSITPLMLELRDALASFSKNPSALLRRARLKTAVEHAIILIAEELQTPERKKERPARDLAGTVRKLVELDSRHPPKLPEMAKAAGLGVTRFAKLFKTETGMTPADFALRLRCELAAETLRNSKLNISEAAYRHGFSSGQHFTMTFKKHMGSSPGSLRAKAKSGRGVKP